MPRRSEPASTVRTSEAFIANEAESTRSLIERHRAGDREALDRLFSRYLPSLSRWASHRLPQWARDIADTQDLVQETLLQTFNRMDVFEPVGEGAFQAYLRQALFNRIRDEIRKCGRRPGRGELDSQQEDDKPSPLEEAIGSEATDRYEKALAALKPEEREAIIFRVELGFSYAELALALDKPSPDAARMAAQRALVRLAEEMGRAEKG